MKKNNNSNGSSSILGLLAFIAIIIKSASFILDKFDGNLGIISFIGDIILAFVALIVAWGFAKKSNKFFKILYIIILVLVIVSFILGAGTVI